MGAGSSRVSADAPPTLVKATADGAGKFRKLGKDTDEEKREGGTRVTIKGAERLLAPVCVPRILPFEFLGPASWDVSRSVELQEVVESFSIGGECAEILGIEFSVTLADPGLVDCPLVACSVGFSKLTHYTLDEIIGKNCRFLLNGVPPDLIDENVRLKSRTFCFTAVGGYAAQDRDEDIPMELQAKLPSLIALGEGEVLCIQTNAKKSGELFRNMFFMKTVELDDHPYIIALQAGLPEEFDDEGSESEKLREACAEAFTNLSGNMSAIEGVLASHFWYSAAMRRQV